MTGRMIVEMGPMKVDLDIPMDHVLNTSAAKLDFFRYGFFVKRG